MICPKCFGPCNEGAAICYTCKNVINWKEYVKIQWLGWFFTVIISAGIILGFLYLFR